MDGRAASVFKSYDIRGTCPDQINESFAYRLGRALTDVLPARRVIVGYDARLSSLALCGALVAGLKRAGARVGSLGLCPTELVYYAVSAEPPLGADLGVMITASHNPPRYNGFKIVKAGGEPVSASTGLGAIRRRMAETGAPAPGAGAGADYAVDALGSYVDFALRLLGAPLAPGLRIIVDAGNGVAGLLWAELEPRLGANVLWLNGEPDGRFPAHHPDPSRQENLQQLVAAMRRERADIGFAYDGDADRVVVVLRDGHVVDGSEMIACIAARLLGDGAGLVFGVGQTTSRKALDHFRAIGAEPEMLPVGHAKIKAAMRAQPQMSFAGEDAGHYYYRDFYCCDSSLLTTLHLLHLAVAGGLEPLVQSLPGPWHRPTREPAFDFADPQHARRVCQAVAGAMLGSCPGPVEISCEVGGRVERHCAATDVARADGVRVDYPDWWFCVRPSGTEPIARLAAEARTESLLAERLAALTVLFQCLDGA